jgi:hypothetical protein
MLPLFISSSNILSHLATLKVNLNSYQYFWTDYKEEHAEDLACVGRTSSAVYTYVHSHPNYRAPLDASYG